MENATKKKLLRAPPNLTLNNKQTNNFLTIKQKPQLQLSKQQNKFMPVSSLNLSRIADRTQRTQFKEQESIWNDFGVLLNNDTQNINDDEEKDFDSSDRNGFKSDNNKDLQTIQVFEVNYEIALNLITSKTLNSTNRQSQTLKIIKAYEILVSLIEGLKTNLKFIVEYQMAENVLLNYWKVSNQLFFDSNQSQPISRKELINKQTEQTKILGNMNDTFDLLEQYVQRQNIKLNRLTVLCLLLAKESFRRHNIPAALRWCDKGFKHCPRFKNTSLLLKLHYLKSRIYQQMNATEPQMQQVKKCLFLLKSLSLNATQNKQFSYDFIKALNKRKQELSNIISGNQDHKFSTTYNNKSTQKTNNQRTKSISVNKFRKRSISLSKLKIINDADVNSKSSSNLKNNFKTAIKKQLQQANIKNGYDLSAVETKKESLKLEINRKGRLKKKGHTQTVWQKNSEKIRFQDRIGKQLQKAAQSLKKEAYSEHTFKELMLRRPNEGKKKLIDRKIEDEDMQDMSNVDMSSEQSGDRMEQDMMRKQRNKDSQKKVEWFRKKKFEDIYDENRIERNEKKLSDPKLKMIQERDDSSYPFIRNGNGMSRNIIIGGQVGAVVGNRSDENLRGNNDEPLESNKTIKTNNVAKEAPSRAEVELSRYVSSIQEEILNKYINKLLKKSKDSDGENESDRQEMNYQQGVKNEKLMLNKQVEKPLKQQEKRAQVYQFQAERPKRNQYRNQISSIRGSNTRVTNIKRADSFKDRAIQEQDEQDLVSFSKNYQVKDNNHNQTNTKQHIQFEDLVTEDSPIITPIGVVEQLSVQVRIQKDKQNKNLKHTLHCIVQQDQQKISPTNGMAFRLQIYLKLNQQYYKLYLFFPISRESTKSALEFNNILGGCNKKQQGQSSSLREEFNRWLIGSMEYNEEERNEEHQLSHQMFKQLMICKNISLNLQNNLIYKIITNLSTFSNPQLGYTIPTQKLSNFFYRHNHYNEQRDTQLYSERQRNFQYLPQSNILKSTSQLLSIDWKHSTTKSIPIYQIYPQNNIQTHPNTIHRNKVYFIELGRVKIQHNSSQIKLIDKSQIKLKEENQIQHIIVNDETNKDGPSYMEEESQDRVDDNSIQKEQRLVFEMCRFNLWKLNKPHGDKSSYINKYIIRNCINTQTLNNSYEMSIQRNSNSYSQQSRVNIVQEDENNNSNPKFTDEESLAQINHSPKTHNNNQQNHLLSILKQLYCSISYSFYPKLKYNQLLKRLHLSSLTSFTYNVTRNRYSQLQKPQKSIKQSIVQPKSNLSFQQQQYPITVMGSQLPQRMLRKKGSVRKSQIIQLQESFTHNNFLQQIIKTNTTTPSPFLLQTKSKTYFSPQSSNTQKHKNKHNLTPNKYIEEELNQKSEQSSQKSQSNQNQNTLVNKSLYQSTIKNKLSNVGMAKILKKALIQPDYKKSNLLMTYFDWIQISSFYNIMGKRPNYIKLSCFKLKSIYIESEEEINYYYLFELQEKEARTRMHKFIIGDREIKDLIGTQNRMKENYQTNINKENSNMIRRKTKHTRTLPSKKKSLAIEDELDEDNLSQQQQVQRATSSHLRTKKSIFQNKLTRQTKPIDSIGHFTAELTQYNNYTEFVPSFTQSSLTTIMKHITPLFVIKKDYIYTSIYLNSHNPIFYLINKFTIEHQALNILQKQYTSTTQISNTITTHNPNKVTHKTLPPNKNIPTSLSSYRISNNLSLSKSDFLNKQIKSKKILCQKSLILKVTQHFISQTQQHTQIVKKQKTTNKKSHIHPSSDFKKQSQRNKNNKLNKQSKEQNKGLYDLRQKQCKEEDKGLVYQQLFSILTIIKISKSYYFTIKLYIPKYQRSYTITLDNSFLNYLQPTDFKVIFGDFNQTLLVLDELNSIQRKIQDDIDQKKELRDRNQHHSKNSHLIQQLILRKKFLIQQLSLYLFQQQIQNQKFFWNNLLSIIKIEQKYTEDRVYLVLKVSNFTGFIKDCSFLEYFQQNSAVYMIEMTLNKKSHHSQYFPKEQWIDSLPGGKIKRGVLTAGNFFNKDRKYQNTQTYKNNFKNDKRGPSGLKEDKNVINTQAINSHNQQFQKLGFIYESKTQSYTLYVQIFKILDEQQKNIKRRKTQKQSICQALLKKVNQIDKQEEGSEPYCSNLSMGVINNNIKKKLGSDSKTGSHVSFPNLKSKTRFNRKEGQKNTFKSTIKSINFNLDQNLRYENENDPDSKSNQLINFKKQKNPNNNLSRRKILNKLKKNEKIEQQNNCTQINKLNFSFYLSELNNLFKYIDENYSEQFNQEYFLQAQINIGFRILGNAIIEEFKGLKKRVYERRKQTVYTMKGHRSKMERAIQQDEQRNDGVEINKRQKKKTIEKKHTNKILYESIHKHRVNQSQGQKCPQHFSNSPRFLGHKGSDDNSIDKIRQLRSQGVKEENVGDKIRYSQNVGNKKLDFSIEELFLRYQNQKKFKIKILQRLYQFDIQVQKLEAEEKGLSQSQQSSLVESEIKRQRLISLHSRLASPQLIDLHILPFNKVSSLFHYYDSFLFLISNIQQFQIFTISIKLDQQHPFSFIHLLKQKNQLQSINNRLFKFYTNLLKLTYQSINNR